MPRILNLTLKHIFQRLKPSLNVKTLTGPSDMSRLPPKHFLLTLMRLNSVHDFNLFIHHEILKSQFVLCSQNSFYHLHINFMFTSCTKTSSANEQNRMLMSHTFSCSNMHPLIIHINCLKQSISLAALSTTVNTNHTLAITCNTDKHVSILQFATQSLLLMLQTFDPMQLLKNFSTFLISYCRLWLLWW
jgi:hypothetical protein